MNQPTPYYLTSTDWGKFIDDYPPPPIYQRTVGAMSADALYALQNGRFMQRMAEAWATPFYRALWEAAGIGPDDVRSLGDISKLPVFTTDELRKSTSGDSPLGTHHPYGLEGLASTPLKLQTSGGTTGMPRMTLFDPIAMEVQGVQTARALYAQGARPGGVVQIPYTLSLANAGWCAYNAAHHWLGCLPITSGSGNVTPSERQLEYAKAVGTTCWFSGADYLGRMASVAKEIGFDLHQLPTQFLSTFLGADPEGMVRKALQQAWNAPVYDNYGSHEIGLAAFECREGVRHINEDTVLVEICDEAGTPLPDGEFGTAVVTALHRQVPIFIRYNLRDRLAVHSRIACACGLSTRVLSALQGRMDQMIKLRGTNVYPSACQTAVRADTRTNGEYLCVVEHVGEGLGRRLEMTVRVERRSADIPRDALQQSLEEALHKDLDVRVSVDVVDAGELLPFTGSGEKIRRVLDLRK